MTFRSILFQHPADWIPDEGLSAPVFFVDLKLDQIVAAITARKGQYNLKPFFYMPLHDADAIAWRHEIMRDLEDASLLDNINAFARDMGAMRENLAQSEKLSFRLQKERWFLDAAGIYCNAVVRLAHDLSVAELRSRGLSAFREYVTRYAASESFASLMEQTKKIVADLSAIRYNVLIDGLRVEVTRYDGELDYAAEVEATFEKFKRSAVKEYKFNFIDLAHMNSVEERIVALVARLHPEIFSALEQYCAANKGYPDRAIVIFDREIQFHVAYLEHVARFRNAGLNFCYPRVVEASKEVRSVQGFDLALADKLVAEGGTVVCNDFHLEGAERILVVSGPNQGGKTTFARTFGQLHYLASLGCPVPGTHAQLFLFDNLFTHFEKEENIKNFRGKLQDDLLRVRQILERATPDSIIIMNEVFTSTTWRDAIALSRKIAEKFMALDLMCVWVTFVDELASLSEKTVSMVSTVVPENPALRTFKIVRRPADGLAYAMCLAEKYRLTYAMIRERIGS
jgi:DNA mismatch repair ATPase MutS